MQTFALSSFLADRQARAVATGVAAIPVDSLRNKGGSRTERKRALLARAALRGQTTIISYY